MDLMPMYDDDSECAGDQQCFSTNMDDYDYEYVQEQESLVELYQYCISPTLNDTLWYLIPLTIASFTCNVAARINYIPHKMFHSITASTGIYVLYNYAYECFFLLLFYVILSYLFLHLPKKHRQGTKVFLPSIFLILYCEVFMHAKDWNKIRGVVMIAVMKAISLTVDMSDTDKIVNVHEYIGYMLCGITAIFGPWTSFETYTNLYNEKKWKLWWFFVVISYAIVGLFCLSISNCWTNWILSDNAAKWMVAFRDAFGFRTSHYFVCFISSAIMLLGGYPLTQSLLTKPLEIEVPRSLVQVVVSWNMPMHNWLKTYVFRPGRKQLGRFGAIILTYLASSLLHGLNFQLAAVLLSLGFYTYIEYQLRQLLATEFNACIGSKQCSAYKCEHLRTTYNCYWVVLVNGAFSILAIFHLAYLGLMFDASETQETGYSYQHTINKWSELNFASHWVACTTYLAYYLIR
ncbi:protein-serine O-palmitoleoyltransferase porcupine [Trichogramma pretiosum]|uniref:Protein-serine O-palmitoleoyltransferase porcupine n=1 Tax=Trichogramma kaykai TaxID=54128 RepID=A0ABD2W4U4_9HYME|nr:protein-serine O-palmitoleoyltransferase porcupine [Trichogramma pretiosum]